MSLSKEVKREIENMVGDRVWIDFELLKRYEYPRSHELILDNTISGHNKRDRLRNQMRVYCIKLINKNKKKKEKEKVKE